MLDEETIVLECKSQQRNVPPPRTPPIKPPMTPREKRAQKRNTPKAKQLPPAPTPQELRKTRASSARKRQRNGNVCHVTQQVVHHLFCQHLH